MTKLVRYINGTPELVVFDLDQVIGLNLTPLNASIEDDNAGVVLAMSSGRDHIIYKKPVTYIVWNYFISKSVDLDEEGLEEIK